MAASKGSKPGRGKWWALGTIAVAGFLAVETGWAGFGWAHLKSAVFPRDESLLAWVPARTDAVVIVDPHLLDAKALGGEGTTARAALERTRDDVKKATGIDLALDVDKLVLTSSLVVARGRFDRKKLTERLSEHRYTIAEHHGEPYLVRAGEDAIGVYDDSLLLYGDEASLKDAIDAHREGKSVANDEQVTKRLSQARWSHPVLGTYRITDDKPSVRAILTGSTGPRAVTVGVGTVSGLDVDANIEAATPSAGGELAKLLDEKRQNAGGLVGLGGDATPVLVDAAKKATIKSDPETGVVTIHVHLDPAQLDTLAKSARSAPWGEYYKTVRLFQLLSPIQ
jgi:hypothetical protein